MIEIYNELLIENAILEFAKYKPNKYKALLVDSGLAHICDIPHKKTFAEIFCMQDMVLFKNVAFAPVLSAIAVVYENINGFVEVTLFYEVSGVSFNSIDKTLEYISDILHYDYDIEAGNNDALLQKARRFYNGIEKDMQELQAKLDALCGSDEVELISL